MSQQTNAYIEARDDIMRVCREYQLEARCSNALISSMLMDLAHQIQHNDKAICL